MKYLIYSIVILMIGLLFFLSMVQVIDIWVYDLVVIEVNGVYYFFCMGMGIVYFIFIDLENWEEVDLVFLEKLVWMDEVVLEFCNYIWVFDIFFYNGQYYIYYLVLVFVKNIFVIGVVIIKLLDLEDEGYGWIDYGIVIQFYFNWDFWNVIDLNIVFDDEGVLWMFFGFFWDGLKFVRMDFFLFEIVELQEWYIIVCWECSFELSDKNLGDVVLEVLFIFKKDGWYYQFFFWDLCCCGVNSIYKVVVGCFKNVEGFYFDWEGKNFFYGGGSLVVEGNENWYGVGYCSVYYFKEEDYMFMYVYDVKDEGCFKFMVKKI